jgi:small subunit ribosomal protein S18
MRKKKKRCRFCKNKIDDVDYKDTSLLKGFINERGKILGSKITKLCSSHQRHLARAIKRAREIALLPYELK